MIEIINLTKIPVDKTFFLGVAKKVLKGENRGMENVSIAFVSPEEIHKLNKKYRKKDTPTDVLSFGKVSEFKDEFSEVVICPEVVREKYQDSILTNKEKLAKMLIHGILHNIGYDHERSAGDEKIMQEKEDHYFSKI
jgi:probable rRNA maturation factor